MNGRHDGWILANSRHSLCSELRQKYRTNNDLSEANFKNVHTHFVYRTLLMRTLGLKIAKLLKNMLFNKEHTLPLRKMLRKKYTVRFLKVDPLRILKSNSKTPLQIPKADSEFQKLTPNSKTSIRALNLYSEF